MRCLTIQSPSGLPEAVSHPSLWHTPLPYVYGGIIVLLGMIAFALLMLTCSPWRLSGQLNNNDSDTGKDAAESVKTPKDCEERILVIMAGDNIPTFIAKPLGRAALYDEENTYLS